MLVLTEPLPSLKMSKTDHSEDVLKNFIKQNMIAGLLVIIPIGLTYIVMAFVIGKLDKLMAPVVKGDR